MLIGVMSFKADYTKVIIAYVSFKIMTPIKVDCQSFESAYGDKLKTLYITDNKDIDSLNLFLNKLEPDTNGYFPDVRIKIILCNSNDIDTLCMSESGLVFNGMPMKRSKDLLDYVMKLISIQQ